MAMLCGSIQHKLSLVANAVSSGGDQFTYTPSFSYAEFAKKVLTEHLKTCKVCDVNGLDNLKMLLGISGTQG